MLKVNEIFYSIQGESTFAGLPFVFIRLTGCNLRCNYCDTTYAYHKGVELSVEEIEDQVYQYDCKFILITGGEPLLQKETAELAQSFIKKGMQVLVETNGTQNIDLLSPPVIRIMDIKCPGSYESEKMDWKNLDRLKPKDEVKFVISTYEDFKWAVSVISKYKLLNKATILFSPAFNTLEPKELAQWLLDIKLPIRLQIQQHKYIWIK